jgi:hypothetical protein
MEQNANDECLHKAVRRLLQVQDHFVKTRDCWNQTKTFDQDYVLEDYSTTNIGKNGSVCHVLKKVRMCKPTGLVEVYTYVHNALHTWNNILQRKTWNYENHWYG